MVIGGHDGTHKDELATAEVYTLDDVQGGPGSWASLPPMQTARKHPAAAVLADGRVVVAGGYFTPPIEDGDMKAADARLALGASKGNILASAEVYLPKEAR